MIPILRITNSYNKQKINQVKWQPYGKPFSSCSADGDVTVCHYLNYLLVFKDIFSFQSDLIRLRVLDMV